MRSSTRCRPKQKPRCPSFSLQNRGQSRHSIRPSGNTIHQRPGRSDCIGGATIRSAPNIAYPRPTKTRLKSPPEKQTAPRVQTRIAGGSAAPPGDAKQMRLCRLILTSSTGLLDPPATSMSHNQTHRRELHGQNIRSRNTANRSR